MIAKVPITSPATGTADRDGEKAHGGVAERRVAGDDCRQHGAEHGYASAVVEETFALEDRGEPGRRLDLAQQRDDRDGVGRGQNRPEQEAARPAESER